MDEYTPLEARVNHNGTVDVLIDGAAVPGGSGLTMEAVLELLTRYAGENGKLLMTTTHPNGSVARDLVSETGEVTPFYPDARNTSVEAAEAMAPSQEALLQMLKQTRNRKVRLPDVEAAPAPGAVAPTTSRVTLGEGSIPKFDVEADVKKALASKNPPRSKTKALILVLVITVLALAGLAAAGWVVLTGGVPSAFPVPELDVPRTPPALNLAGKPASSFDGAGTFVPALTSA